MGLTWEAVWKIGSVLIELAREMAVGEGLSAEEYDRRVAELESQRHITVAGILATLHGMLQP